MIFLGLNLIAKILLSINFFKGKNLLTETEDAWPALILDSDRQTDGSIINLSADLQAYYVAPKNLASKKAIFLHFDIFGWTGGRIRSVADHIAKENYHVFLVNFFDNDNGISAHGGLPPTWVVFIKYHFFWNIII